MNSTQFVVGVVSIGLNYRLAELTRLYLFCKQGWRGLLRHDRCLLLRQNRCIFLRQDTCLLLRQHIWLHKELLCYQYMASVLSQRQHIYPVSAAGICPVSTADISFVSTAVGCGSLLKCHCPKTLQTSTASCHGLRNSGDRCLRVWQRETWKHIESPACEQSHHFIWVRHAAYTDRSLNVSVKHQ